ncbi:hypothetical protein MMC07_002936 [Pseudocyphellaria aurata]|nr:hypothetical protein [Pseudocyphellaria aurata]
MATATGEECVLDVYVDVYYYFSPPTLRPVSHRRDKESRLCLYRYSSRDGGLLVIANNLGTPEQDAFTGPLSTTKIQQTHKHPARVTVIVDGYQGTHETASPPIQNPEHHWRLPNTDPRNEGKFLFRLHTLDIYFGTDENANSFIDKVGKLVQQQQLEILDVPQTPIAPEKVMSPIVQRLENVANRDPAYHNEHTRAVLPSFSPPSVANERQEVPKTEDPGANQPQPYNPASPGAPEPRKEREETLPPPESEMSPDPRWEPLSSSVRTQVEQGNVSPHQDHGRKSSYAINPLSNGYVNPQSYHPASSGSYIHPVQPSGVNASNPYANTVSLAPPNQSTGNSPGPQSNPTSTYPSAEESNPPDFLGNSYVVGPPRPSQHIQPKYANYLDDVHRQAHKPTKAEVSPNQPVQKSSKFARMVDKGITRMNKW